MKKKKEKEKILRAGEAAQWLRHTLFFQKIQTRFPALKTDSLALQLHGTPALGDPIPLLGGVRVCVHMCELLCEYVCVCARTKPLTHTSTYNF